MFGMYNPLKLLSNIPFISCFGFPIEKFIYKSLYIKYYDVKDGLNFLLNGKIT